MLLSDIKSEADIPSFAVLEFKKYGQPLDNFLELFTLRSESAKRVVSRFASVYHESIPTTDYDAALPGIAESGKLALLMYIAPKASEQARADLFVKSDDLKVLNILFAGATHESVRAKLSDATAKGNVAIVEFLFPRWLSGERRINALKPVTAEDTSTHETTVPEEWIIAASKSQSLEILQLLLPYSDGVGIDKALLDAASSGHTDVALLLAKYSSASVPEAVAKSVEHGHLELAVTLAKLYPSRKTNEVIFPLCVGSENMSMIRELAKSVGIASIDAAMAIMVEKQKFEIVEILVEHASPTAIEEAAEQMIGKVSASSALEKTLPYIPDSVTTLFEKASKVADHEAVRVLLPFVALDSIADAFPKACKKNKTKVVSLLSPLVKTEAADSCFQELGDLGETEPNLLEQLLPRMSREAVSEVDTSSLESVPAAISNRIKGFAVDIAFVHAFRVVASGYSEAISEIAESEAKKYGTKLYPLCTTSEDCVKTIEASRASVSTAALEEAIGVIGESPDTMHTTVPHLFPVATPFVCTQLLESSLGISLRVPEFVRVCAGQASKSAVADECLHVVSKENFKAMEALLPFTSPTDIFKILSAEGGKKPSIIHDILKPLSQSQVDSILSIATRKYAYKYDGRDAMLLNRILGKASKSAVDASLLYAARCKTPNRKYVDGTLSQCNRGGARGSRTVH